RGPPGVCCYGARPGVEPGMTGSPRPGGRGDARCPATSMAPLRGCGGDVTAARAPWVTARDDRLPWGRTPAPAACCSRSRDRLGTLQEGGAERRGPQPLLVRAPLAVLHVGALLLQDGVVGHVSLDSGGVRDVHALP